MEAEFERAKQEWAQKELDYEQDREIMFNKLSNYRTSVQHKENELLQKDKQIETMRDSMSKDPPSQTEDTSTKTSNLANVVTGNKSTSFASPANLPFGQSGTNQGFSPFGTTQGQNNNGNSTTTTGTTNNQSFSPFGTSQGQRSNTNSNGTTQGSVLTGTTPNNGTGFTTPGQNQVPAGQTATPTTLLP